MEGDGGGGAVSGAGEGGQARAAGTGEGGEFMVGWCAREVAETFPELRIVTCEVRLERALSLTGSSPPALKERLRELSNRWAGAQAIMLRSQPVPAAYRVFFRHIGLDPDVQRTPLEEAVMRRLIDGGFLPRGLLEDVLLAALVDTGVAVWALAADTLDGPLGLRLSSTGERLGRDDAKAPQLQAGQLVVADASRALAPLFGVPEPSHRPRGDSRRLALFSLQVAGVSTLHVEEALWSCRTTLESLGRSQ
jgi:DNA/RNA-binding domain of Phe-tRNA-synthetase-like protein